MILANHPCPNCKVILECEGVSEGELVDCPQCGKPFEVPFQKRVKVPIPPPTVSLPDPIVPKKNTDEKFCQECGEVIKAKAVICPKCGCPQKGTGSILGDGRNKTTAGILALLLGGIGFQYFYIGKPMSGILCILFCWTYIPLVVGLIEGIYYLTMTDQKFQTKFSGEPFKQLLPA